MTESHVRVTDAYGLKHDAIATTGVVKGHKFPVVWVKFTPDGVPMPWPEESVEFLNSEQN